MDKIQTCTFNDRFSVYIRIYNPIETVIIHLQSQTGYTLVVYIYICYVRTLPRTNRKQEVFSPPLRVDGNMNSYRYLYE